MEYIRNKKLLAAVAVFLVLVLLGGIFFITRNQNISSKDADIRDGISDSSLPSLDPSDIGMVVTLRPDGKALMFEIKKASDIQGIEYTIEYEKEIEGERVPEGIFGLMNIAEDGITKTDYREFGTCSSGRCRYDDVVSDITIILKVTKKDGKEYQVEKVVKL